MESIVETLRKWVEQFAEIAASPGEMGDIPFILAGGILLLFGRRLYWGVVIMAGFLAGAWAGHEVLPPEPKWLAVAAALLLGIVTVILSICLQRLALRLAGLITGGFLGYVLVAAFLAKPWPLVGLALGCLFGFWLVMRLFDWALIVLSSLSGTALIVVRLSLEGIPLIVAGLVLALLGIAAQASMEKKRAGKSEPKSA